MTTERSLVVLAVIALVFFLLGWLIDGDVVLAVVALVFFLLGWLAA